MISTQKYSQLNIKIKDFFNSFELIKCFQITHHVIHQFDYVENEYETSFLPNLFSLYFGFTYKRFISQRLFEWR